MCQMHPLFETLFLLLFLIISLSTFLFT
jgi:hypothetical protein